MKRLNLATSTELPAAHPIGRRAVAVMLNNTLEHLRAMKLSAFASELERQMEDAGSYNQLGFEDRLTLLVDSEWNRRQHDKLPRLISRARFSDPGPQLKALTILKTGILTKERCCVLRPAGMSMRHGTSSS
jgi:hypothetical protein